MKVDDLIDRQTVINRIANTCFWLSGDDWNELMDRINSISPISSGQIVAEVLKKIRAEIELKEKTLIDKYGQQKYGIWTDDVLQIIDKYKEESEEM